MTFHESQRPSFIEERAVQLAADCTVSGNFGNTQLDYYALSRSENRYAPWRDYSGKKILDVGAGVSDLTARLLSKGADAYALDLGYGNVKQFISQLPQRGGWSAGPLFLKSLEQNPSRYVAGSAHKLPFESGTFDAVLSHYGILGVLDQELELLLGSVNEAIRVLKPEGICRIGPFQGGELSKLQKANQASLVERLTGRTDIESYPHYPVARRSRAVEKIGQLTIFKAS